MPELSPAAKTIDSILAHYQPASGNIAGPGLGIAKSGAGADGFDTFNPNDRFNRLSDAQVATLARAQSGMAAVHADGADQLGARMLDELKNALGNAWENTLSPEERQIAVDVMNDLAGLTLTSITAGIPFEPEQLQLEAQLRGITSIEFDRTKHYFFTAAAKAIAPGLDWLAKHAGPYVPIIGALGALL